MTSKYKSCMCVYSDIALYVLYTYCFVSLMLFSDINVGQNMGLGFYIWVAVAAVLVILYVALKFSFGIKNIKNSHFLYKSRQIKVLKELMYRTKLNTIWVYFVTILMNVLLVVMVDAYGGILALLPIKAILICVGVLTYFNILFTSPFAYYYIRYKADKKDISKIARLFYSILILIFIFDFFTVSHLYKKFKNKPVKNLRKKEKIK